VLKDRSHSAHIQEDSYRVRSSLCSESKQLDITQVRSIPRMRTCGLLLSLAAAWNWGGRCALLPLCRQG
jgi:hypothetical protein